MGLFSSLTGIFKSVGSALDPVMPLLSAGADVFGGILGANSAKDINEQNIQQSKDQMAWSERMSSTAHQREVTDLKAAGLNPILSVNGGASMGSYQLPNLSNPGESLQRGINSAVSSNMEYRNLQADLEMKKAMTKNYVTEALVKGAEMYRQLLDNKVRDSSSALELKQLKLRDYLLDRRLRAKDWEGLKDDINEGIQLINPFNSVHASSAVSTREWR